jgi:DNA-binding transcriptional MocR family regulator
MRLPGMISFGGGYPHPDTFALESFSQTFKNGRSSSISNADLIPATQYGPSDCLPELSEYLYRWHHFKDGVTLSPEQLLVLNGSQEGLHMMAYLFLDPNDSVAISEPAYPGALGAFRAFTNHFITFPIDEQGSRVDILEQRLRDRQSSGEPLPKFIYEVPNGHNPGGVGLSLTRRKQLIALASQYDLLILEDDPYELLQLEDRAPLPTLQSLDMEGRVIRLDSFSKIFAPGLRLGYMSGPVEIMKKMLYYKQGLNLHTSSFTQRALAGFFESHSFEEFMTIIARNCLVYRAHRDAMVDAIEQYLPKNMTYNIPREGMFIWFEGPENMNVEERIVEKSRDLNVLVVPGTAFSPTGGLKNGMRASFSMVSPDQIVEGMRRLSKMLQM